MKIKYNKIFYICFSSIILFLHITGYIFLGVIVERFTDLFSDSSALYFYSALFQANAAIVSILGVFFIFRLQLHQSSIDLIKNGLLADNGHRSWPTEIIEWDSYTLNEKEKLLEEEKTNKSGSCNTSIIEQLNRWTFNERNLDDIKKTMITPLVYIVVVMILEIFCLFTATYIHQLGLIEELFFMYNNLILEFSILIMVLYNIIVNIRKRLI